MASVDVVPQEWVVAGQDDVAIEYLNALHRLEADHVGFKSAQMYYVSALQQSSEDEVCVSIFAAFGGTE